MGGGCAGAKEEPGLRMSADLTTKWTSKFFETLENDRSLASELRVSSLDASLGRWTSALTTAVVKTFDALQMPAAGKAHSCSTLPIARQEYLALDVTAFYKEQPGWQFPAAVCELENAKNDTRIAYSLWKLLCVRADLRVVFCYRPYLADAPALLSLLADSVVAQLPIEDRVALHGETLVVIGSRGEANTFPYGFFQLWRLSANTGRFERFARK